MTWDAFGLKNHQQTSFEQRLKVVIFSQNLFLLGIFGNFIHFRFGFNPHLDLHLLRFENARSIRS